MTNPVPRVAATNPSVSHAVDDAVARMMAKGKSERPATAAEAIAPLGGDVPSTRTVVATPTAMDAPATGEGSGKHLALAETFQPASAPVSIEGSKRKGPWIAIGATVAAAAIGVGGYFAVASGRGTSAAVPESPVASAPASPFESSVQPVPTLSATGDVVAAPPKTVSLRVDGAPKGAHAFLGEEDLGEVPGPFDVARDDSEKSLTVKASGYEATSATFTPKEDVTVAVRMQKKGKRPGGKPAISKDLEGF